MENSGKICFNRRYIAVNNNCKRKRKCLEERGRKAE